MAFFFHTSLTLTTFTTGPYKSAGQHTPTDTMNGTYKLSPTHSPRAIPLRMEDTVLEAPPHSSFEFAGLSQIPYSSQMEPGLGISQYEPDDALNQMRPHPPSGSCLLPMTGWSTQLPPTEQFYATTMSVAGVSPESFFGPCSLTSGASNSPLSFCSAQAPGPQVVNNPGPGVDHGLFYDQLLSSWMASPTPNITAPFKEAFTFSDAPVSMSFSAAYSDPTLLPQEQVFAAAEAPLPSHQVPSGTANSRVFGPDMNAIDITDRNHRATFHGFPTKSVPETGCSVDRPHERVSGSKKRSSRKKSSLANGHECSICGFVFTRRSNCREHMKKHDPSRRRAHPCGICGRPFERRTDLRRHVHSVRHSLYNDS